MRFSLHESALIRAGRYLLLLAAVLLVLVGEIIIIDRRRSNSSQPSTGKDAARLGSPGTVRYRDSALLWTDCASGQQLDQSRCRGKPRLLDWKGAARYCQDLDLAGRKNWRLPTREEMEQIIHCSYLDPTRCLDIDLFPREARQRCYRQDFRRAPVYWTATGPVRCFVQGTEQTGPTQCAWAVRFHHRECGRMNVGIALRRINRRGRVRCVGE